MKSSEMQNNYNTMGGTKNEFSQLQQKAAEGAAIPAETPVAPLQVSVPGEGTPAKESAPGIPWGEQHAQNDILRPVPQASPAEKPKKKADPVKWAAIALAGVFAATTVFSTAALGKVSLNGSTLIGTVTAVNGNSITVSAGSSGRSGALGGMPGDMSGNMQQGTPPDMQNGEPNGTAPDSGTENNANTGTSGKGFGQSAPEQGQMADGNFENGQVPDGDSGMPNEFGGSKQDSGNSAGEITVKISAATKVSGDDTEIKVGDTVTITFGAFNSAKTIAVSNSKSNSDKNFGGNFGGMPNGAPGENGQQSDNTAENNTGDDAGSQT